jgi:hypothetical protein
MSLDSGAEPDTSTRMRPPSRSRSFENTSLSAMRCWAASPAGTGFPASLSVVARLPTRTAQAKIFALRPPAAVAEPAAAL